MKYQLFYWSVLQGRGEFGRLVMEDGGLEYADVARLPESDGGGFAPPLAVVMPTQHCFSLSLDWGICLSHGHGRVAANAASLPGAKGIGGRESSADRC
jgi:hypothetical protein